jgi:PKD repeat protein
MSQTENSVTVKFIPYFVTANQYRWDFGDGNNSIDTSALHKYEVTKTKEFKVTLTINYNGQNYSKSKIIKLQSINDTTKIDASFDTVTVSRSRNSVTIKFSPRTRNVDSYEWDFGNGQTSRQKEPNKIST